MSRISSVSGGELFDRIVDEDAMMTEEEVRDHMRQLLLGVGHMQKNKLVHLDLKLLYVTNIFSKR